ncbi:MAG: HlyD family secretion protein [Fimbriiglobus sp.]|nr:HlyD family secretion protein [Fimbriiglobus sp.]
MSERGRAPSFFVLLAVVLLVGSLGAAGWYFFVPKPTEKPPLSADDLDVVCTGRVDASQMVISLDPAQPGRVVSVSVEEGASVKEGQEILRLDDSLAAHRRKQAEAALTAAGIDLDRAKAEAERFPDAVKIRRATVAASAEQVTVAEKQLEALRAAESVRKPGTAEVAALEATIRQLKELKRAEEIGLQQLEKSERDKVPEFAVRAATARLAAAQADLDLAKKAEDECVLRAPADGQIVRLQATKGGTLSPGFVPAVVFAPAGKRVVRAEIDQEYLTKVKPGMVAEIRDESRIESPTWKGKVRSVSKWVAQRRTLILEPGEINDVRTLEAVIEPDDDTGLVIGQRMRITIKVK